MYKGIQSSVWENSLRSVFLLISFPLLLWVVVVLLMMIVYSQQWYTVTWAEWLVLANEVLLFLWPAILLWGIISFFFHRQIVFKFTWAKPITRQEVPEIYNIVENLCISRWLGVPKIGIIEDDSMNAFALGWNTKHAWIVFSRWLINRLNKAEIEAVAAHELTHIINKDSLMMIVIVVFVGVVWTLWQILIRVRWSSKEDGKWNIIPLVGLVLLILWYLVYPLIRLALSRKREFLADAGAVELTKDKYAMISALQKISTDARIESIQKDTVAAMCIESPLDAKRPGFFSRLLATHPPIADRIKALESY